MITLNKESYQDGVARVVRAAITKETESIVIEEAKQAAVRVEKRVREMTATIAARVLERFEISMRGPRLTIEVDFKNTEA